MKNQLPFYLLLFITLCLSCKDQNKKESTTIEDKQPKAKLTLQIQSIEKADTLIMANSPTRISRKIRKTKAGNLLIAAFDEVFLYDGNNFSNLPPIEGFKSMDAFDALEDAKGHIWIASTHHGLFRYDGKTYKRFTTENGLPSNRTIDLYEDKAGNIWIATTMGLSCYNGSSFRNFSTKEGLTHNDVSSILEDKTGKIWLGTRGTACVYDPKTAEFKEVITNTGMPFNNVWSIMEDKQNNIWIGGRDGLWRYNGHSFAQLTKEFVNCVYEDKKGNIWTTSPQGLLKYYDANSLFKEEASAVEIFQGNNMFFRVTEDPIGNIWVGTLKGIFRYNGKSVDYFKNNSTALDGLLKMGG
jgi:ligand-binding sensor domain-containing protein